MALIARSNFPQVVGKPYKSTSSVAKATNTCYNSTMEQQVFDKWQYVQKRGNKYGLRVPVPLELKEIIGKGEITRSLGTGDPIAAKKQYGLKLAEIQEILEGASNSLTPSEPRALSPEVATALVREHFSEAFFKLRKRPTPS